MTLFPRWAPLREGYPSIRDWNDFGGALANARGANGVDLSIQAGALVVSGSGVSESPWWRVRMKSGSTTVAQVSGGFVRVKAGYTGSSSGLQMVGMTHGTGAGNPDLWTDVALWFPTIGYAANGYIFAVQLACAPYDNLVVLADDLYGSVNAATYPPGEWEWIRVGSYSVDADGVVSGLRRLFFGGDTIHLDVVPAGTVRMFGGGAGPGAGWRILSGADGRVNAYGLSPRMDLFITSDLNGVIVGTLQPGDHYHDLSVSEIKGTAGTDSLGYGFPSAPQQTGVAGTGARSEKALGVVYYIKL